MNKIQNQKKLNQRFIVFLILFSSMLILTVSGCVQQRARTADQGQKAAAVPKTVDKGKLKSGLSVTYLKGFWRSIGQMPGQDWFLKYGNPGKPIPYINHRFGKGNVFDSGENKGIGVQMIGCLFLDRPGLWQFKALSNDGISVLIDNIQVVNDPNWHARGDRFSDPMGLQATRAGYYGMVLRYFQRKGTATLEFYWKPPGSKEFSIVPKNAYWHLP